MKGVLIAVLMMLLIPAQIQARVVHFMWSPNTDITEGYKMYYREAGTATWNGLEAVEGLSPIVINGRETSTFTLTLPPKRYEVALTAWADTVEGVEVPLIESDMTPIVTVEEGDGIIIMIPSNFVKQ